MQNVNVINLEAAQNAKEKERKRQVVAARINKQVQERKQAVATANAQAREQAQRELREEIKARFMLAPYATEADFNEAWKRDKLTMIREYEHSQRLPVNRM